MAAPQQAAPAPTPAAGRTSRRVPAPTLPPSFPNALPTPGSSPPRGQLPGFPPAPRPQAGTRILSRTERSSGRERRGPGARPGPLSRPVRSGRLGPLGSIAPHRLSRRRGLALTPEKQHQAEVGQPGEELKAPPLPQRHVDRS